MNCLYISIPQRIEVKQPKVHLGELAQISISDKQRQKKLEKILVYDLKDNKVQVVGILEIIEKIEKEAPDLEIVNLGECEFIIQVANGKQPNKVLETIKLIGISLVVFLGSAFSIMTFNEDASVEEVMQRIYLLVMGKEQTSGTVLEVSYSIGLALGIMIFYNHLFRKGKRLDPTPIQVEMRTYEQDVNDTIIINADREGE